MLENLTAADFAPHVGTTFRLEDQLDLELVDVTEGERPGEGRQPFSLLFRGPREPLVAQRIYRLDHDALGLLEIFLVPIGLDEDGARYEAVFT
jgi:Domain of unknown function (DUF6916)